MKYPPSLTCKQLDRKHDEWNVHYPYWEALRKLSEGGQLMYQSAAQFLYPRSKEPKDVYGDRLARFSYTNHFGNIKGWYTSALFKQPPAVIMRSKPIAGESTVIQSGPQVDQLARFQNDCDRGGRSLVQFWAELVEPKLLTYRKAYILFDLLAIDGQLVSKQQQQESDALLAHLRAYSPQDLINWQKDEQGNLLWAVLKLRAVTQDDITSDVVVADRWYVFDRNQVAVYEYLLTKDQQDRNTGILADGFMGLGGTFSSSPYGDTDAANLLYSRPHALSDQNTVPLFEQSIHPDHWIGQRIASPLLRLLNLENSLDWALEQSNLAMLVIFSDGEINAMNRGEAYFLQLKSEDKIQYLEQSGKAFESSQQRVSEYREEIYRLAYLVAQGRSSSASASMQSGYSKEQDMLPARDVLSALGEQIRGAMQRMLQAAADSMDLNITVDVQGFDFLDRSDVTELEVMQKGSSIQEINSPTLERELGKRIVRIQLPDANRELLQVIDGEIDTNSTPNEMQQQQDQQTLSAQLSTAAKLADPKAFADAASAA